SMPAVRAGLRTLIAAPDIEAVWEAASLSELADLPPATDALLLAETPSRRELSRLVSSTTIEKPPGVLLLTENPQDVQRLIGLPLRAWGALLFDVSAAELQAALRALHQGLWCGSPVLLAALLQAGVPLTGRSLDAAGETPVEPLTEREMEVLQWLAQGLANKQIAAALGISEHTVKFHVSSIYAKMGATNRAEAVRIGVQNGWVML
ncbi:MAG TPA: response regulator transcription factor, partial [Anaerolineales bacterium]|nr:response regulator transcription factor [Anaerolineales bacterium]